jgi:hypothetical protein
VSSVREKIKTWVREEAEVMDTWDAHESSVEYGYRLAIEELRERAKRVDECGAESMAREIMREADYLAARLEGEK